MVFPAWDTHQRNNFWEITHNPGNIECTDDEGTYDCPDPEFFGSGWSGRASEVHGLTGCGGAVDIEDYGFVDFPRTEIGPASAVINYDGSNMEDDDPNATFVNEWRMINAKNYTTFHVPKFTNAGYTGSYTNLVNGLLIGDIPVFTYATGGSGCFDGRGITFEIDLSDMARKAIAKKEQKLDIMMKGVYIHDQQDPVDPNPEKSEKRKGGRDGKYESHAAIIGDFGEIEKPTDCMGCVGSLPGDDPYPDETIKWSTGAAQIATNFYADDCEAPEKQMILNFRGKGSTLDLQSGNMQCTFNFRNPEDGLDDQIIVNSTNEEMVNRFHSVFGKLTSTDSFQITGSTTYSTGTNTHNTDGTYKVSDAVLSDFGGIITVTGDNRLYPTILFNRPNNIQNAQAIYNGTYRISLDDEYYIENAGGDAGFENFYDNNVIPELYALPPQGGGDDTNGITGGGRDFILISGQGDSTSNSNTYQVTEFQQKYSIVDGVSNERLRVKQKTTEEVGTICRVFRVNHRPRLEVTYRSRHQYDLP